MRTRLTAQVAYAFVLVDAPPSGSEVPPLLIGVRGAPPLIVLTTLHQPLNNSGLARFGAAGQLRRPVREDHLEALLSDIASGRLLKLQAEASAKSASDLVATRISSTALELAGRQARVMVVDDVDLNLMVARAMLGSLGVHVTGANGGPTALEHLARERFDLVLMDCHMPTVDGYEVTRRVRAARGPNRNTPIVALSASAFAEDRDRALAAGMNDFAPKPIELTSLRMVLEKWLPGYAATAAPKAAAGGA
jgi:CheY-like chemotaxis protein